MAFMRPGEVRVPRCVIDDKDQRSNDENSGSGGDPGGLCRTEAS